MEVIEKNKRHMLEAIATSDIPQCNLGLCLWLSQFQVCYLWQYIPIPFIGVCLSEVSLISQTAFRQVLSDMHRNCSVFLLKHTKKLYTLHMKHYQKPKGNIDALINLCYFVCFKRKYLSFSPEVTWTWYQQCHVLPQHNAFHAT